MSVRRRVEALERTCGRDINIRIPIIFAGLPGGRWREQLAQARESGRRIRVIRFGIGDQAETLEEAEAMVAAHRDRGREVPITVYRRGTSGGEVLAEWDPGLPD